MWDGHDLTPKACGDVLQKLCMEAERAGIDFRKHRHELTEHLMDCKGSISAAIAAQKKKFIEIDSLLQWVKDVQWHVSEKVPRSREGLMKLSKLKAQGRLTGLLPPPSHLMVTFVFPILFFLCIN